MFFPSDHGAIFPDGSSRAAILHAGQMVDLEDLEDLADLVDSVDYTSGIDLQEGTVAIVSHVLASDRSVQAFLASIAEVADQAKRVVELPRSAFMEQVALLGRQRHSAIRLVQQQEGHLAKIREMLTGQVAADEPGRSRLAGGAVGREATQLERLALAGVESARAGMVKMVQRQELLPATDFAKRMNWSKQGLSKALTSGRVFYVDVNGERHYPAFFLDERFGRRQIQTVSKALGTLPGATKLVYMQSPKASLNGLTPLQALAKGKVDLARAAAQAFAQG